MSTNGNFNKPTYIYKRFRVKKADGKSTTVSVDPALVIKACQTMGSLNSVGKAVREAALSFDATDTKGKNRSAHVSQCLQSLVSGTGKPAVSQASPEAPEADEASSVSVATASTEAQGSAAEAA